MNRIYSGSLLIKQLVLLLTMLLMCFSLQAQDDERLPPVTRTYAITQVKIIQSPGRTIDKGTVVIKDGLIFNVGKDIPIPAEAIVIKADSMYVYAGFIDGLSHAGVVKPKDESKERLKDPGNPPTDKAGINPQVDVRTYLNPADKSVEELRSLGFTVAQSVPYGNFFPGQAAVVLLCGRSVNDMVLQGKTALHADFTANTNVYPATIMGIMAKWRELYRNAVQKKSYESLYAANRAGVERPVNDPILEAFYPVIDQKMPVLFKTEKVLEMQRALALKSDLKFMLSLAEVKEAWPIVSKLKGSDVKLWLALALPEEKKEEKKENSTPLNDALAKEQEALDKRKKETIANYTGQAATLHKAGVPFGFSSLTVKPKDIHANLRKMIAAGLPEDAALAALTTTPAQWLGMADRLGTIDKGKIANMVITTKPVFYEKAKVKHVFVDGILYSIEEKEVSKPETTKSIVDGSWAFSTDAPDGTHTGKVIIKDNGGVFSGSISETGDSRQAELKNIKLDGSKLTFSFVTDVEGSQVPVDVSVTIEKSTFNGSMTVGSFGTFPFKGTKDPK